MDAKTAQIIRDTWAPAYALGDDGAMLFYEVLFTIGDAKGSDVRSLFKNSNLRVQAKRLWQMVDAAVKKLDDLDTLVPVLKDLGRRHADYRVRAEHYPIVGEALLATLEKALGPKFTPEVKQAWTAVYGVIATTMQAGAAEAAASKPAAKPAAGPCGMCPVPAAPAKEPFDYVTAGYLLVLTAGALAALRLWMTSR